MKRRFIRVITCVLALVMVTGSFSFAAGTDTTTKPAKVPYIKAHCGYNSVTVKFTKLKEKVAGYELERQYYGEKWKVIKTFKATDTASYKDNRNDKDRKRVGYYRVRAYKYVDGKKVYGDYSWTSRAKAVRQMYIKIKVNGKWKTANGFAGGKYYTTSGNSYSVARVRDASTDYLKSANYTDTTAENFVNELTKAKVVKRNGKKRMVWISTYTQHLYVFKWNGSRWKIEKDWECSTGKAGSPTPMSKKKKLNHKHRWRHNLPYWNCFSSCNAMHGKYSSWEMGKPRSGGCVRNPNSKAQFIYENVAKGSPVVVW